MTSIKINNLTVERGKRDVVEIGATTIKRRTP
jgi:hypothetical protein